MKQFTFQKVEEEECVLAHNLMFLLDHRERLAKRDGGLRRRDAVGLTAPITSEPPDPNGEASSKDAVKHSTLR